MSPKLAEAIHVSTLTLVHNVLFQGLWIMGDSLVQILKKFTHAGYRNAKRLYKQQQLLRLQVLKCWEKITLS